MRNFLKNKKNLGFILVLITSLCYGTMPAVTQKCYEAGLSVDTLLATRYLFSTIFLWTFILLSKREKKVDKNALLLMLALGVATYFCTLSMNVSYQYLPGAIASILVFTYIIFVNVIEVAIGREKIYRSRVACLIFAVAGVVLVIYTPGEGGTLSTKGVVLALLAAVFYSMMSMGMGAKRFKPINAEVIMGYTYIVPAVILVAQCLIKGEPVFPSEPDQWMFNMILAVGPGFFAAICFCTAVKLIGASMASMVNTSEPVIAYIAGILIMSDHITWSATLGGAVIVVVILVLNITERKREAHILS